jgi:mRNA-degrading endonuclease RelE of RelBE toxin-antitoxin system
MSYKIISTHHFEKQLKRLAKKHQSMMVDMAKLGKQLEDTPNMGDKIIENCYKIRMAIASKGKGKRGGARLITYVYVAQESVFLLSIYDKGEQENISQQELKAIIKDLELGG